MNDSSRPDSALGERQLAALAHVARIASEDLELRPMLQRITDALVDLFGWDFVALVRVDRDQRRFVCEAVSSRVPTEVTPGYSRPFGIGVVGHVAASARALLLDDTSTFPDFVDTLHGARSELCVPVWHRDEVVAVLNLESPRPAAFQDQLALVEAIAGQVGGAIASARRYEELVRRAHSLAALSEVSRTALEADDLDRILERTAEYLQRRFDFYLVAIVVAEENGLEWTHRAFACRGPISLDTPERWPVTRGVVGRALRLGVTQLVTDVTRDLDYFAVNDAVISELVVPIRWGNRILGAVNVESDLRGTFAPETCELLELVADQVSGAIRFALLNQRLSETTRELMAANSELERLSQADALTGVANRRGFDTALELEWRRAKRSRSSLALLLLDVDCFKDLNDSLGHLAGDHCLRRVGELLRDGIGRAGDVVARYGGEEFAILLVETDAEMAEALAERLRADLESLAIAHPASTVSAVVTASVGVAAWAPSEGGSKVDLVAAADRALYQAKRRGRNRVVVSSPT